MPSWQLIRTLRLRPLAMTIVIGVFASAWGVSAEAQQRSTQRQYEPARPTISPYVGLLQSNSGAIPNYFSLVRPRLEQQQFNDRVRANDQFRSVQIQRLKASVADGESVPLTGKQAGFMQFQHYYPDPRSRPGR